MSAERPAGHARFLSAYAGAGFTTTTDRVVAPAESAMGGTIVFEQV